MAAEQQDSSPPPPAGRSRHRLVVIAQLMAVIFLAEVAVMWGLSLTPIPDEAAAWLIDGAALSVLCAPAVFWLVFVPSKRAEAALRLREQQLRMVVEDSPELVCRFLPGGEISFVNRSYCDYFGQTSEELLGRNFLSLLPEENRAEVMANIELLTAHSPIRTHEHQVIASDGEIRWQRWTNRALFDEHNRPVGYQAVGIDITEARRADQALVESNERLQQMADTIEDVFWITDWAARRTVYASRAYEKIWGRSLHGLYNNLHDWADGIHPDDRQHALDTFLKLGEESSYDEEYRIVRPDGSVRWIRDRGFPVRDRTGEVHRAVGIAQDITERKQAEEGRRAQLRFLESMDRIDRALRGTTDLDQMLRDVIDLTSSIFQCDRAWLLHPCHLDVPSFQVSVETTRPEYPGTAALSGETPLTPGTLIDCRQALEADGPVTCGPGNDKPVPAETAKQFSVQSQMFMAVQPKVGGPWVIGMHQCSHARIWTEQEQTLFKEIGRRLAGALSSMLSFRELQESEARFMTAFNSNPSVMSISSLAEGRFLEINNAFTRLIGYQPDEVLGRTSGELGLFVDPDARETMRQRMTKDGRISDWEVQVRTKHDKVMDCLFDAEIVELASEKCILITVRDITDRKRAEEQLRLLSSAVEQSTEGIAVVDLQGNLLILNNAFAVMHGYGTEELLGSHLSILHNRGQMPAVEAAIRQTEESGEFSGELWHTRRDGTTFPGLMHNSILRDESGAPIGFIGTLRDITRRKQAEEALRESEERYRELFNNMSSGVAVYEVMNQGKRFVFKDMNVSGLKSTNLATREVIGKDITEAFPNIEKFGLLEVFQEVWRTNKPKYHPVTRYEDKRLASWFDNYVYKLPGGDIVAVFDDATERKRTEEALRASEERLGSIFKAAPIGIGVVSHRVLLDVNDRICEMTGHTRDELVGQNARILYPTDEDYEFVGREKYRQISLHGSGTVETRWQHASGETRNILLSSAPIDPGDLALGVTFTALDITERKKAETERLAQAEAERLLLRELDHRVRNNLSSLISLIDLSRSTAATTQELADSIRSRAQAMATVHSILSSRKRREVPLRKLLESLIQPTHGTRLQYDGPKVVVPLTQAQALGIVINELATNSLKYGAMSIPGGEVALNWETHQTDQALDLTLHWNESNGPPIESQPRPGVGTGLIKGLTRSELRGDARLTYPRQGARHVLKLSLQEMTSARLDRPDAIATDATSSGRQK